MITRSPFPRLGLRWLLLVIGLVAAVGVALWIERQRTPQRGSVTFARDVAPIVFNHCAPCHRPGQSAPFSLTTFDEVRRHADDIAKVTHDRYMPPWLPEPGTGRFAGERRLSEHEIATLAAWAAQGASEGDAADLPPLPRWTEKWQLGMPDLVVKMPNAFTLPPDGRDVYRNFVIPIPVSGTNYVRAVEIRPGNPRIIHHAVLEIDRTSGSRKLDDQEPGAGYSGGMSFGGAEIPDGHFLGWTPGKTPFEGHPDMAWRLTPDTDFVLQLHMRPSGKPEAVQAEIGLFFAEKPPTKHPHALVVRNKSIDIPSGVANHVVTASYELPVEVQVLSVYPHAHYLGRRLEAFALLPDGTTNWLIRIPDWDFNWQDEYRYADAIFLPAGSEVRMQYTFDNSAANPRNPNTPPRHVTYGQKSTDEMAELMIQVLPRTDSDLDALRQHSMHVAIREDIEIREARIRGSPPNARQHFNVAMRYLQLNEPEPAVAHLQTAVDIEPDLVEAQLRLGDLLGHMARFDEALKHLQTAVRLDSNRVDALMSASKLLAHPDVVARDPVEAVKLARRAVELTGRTDPVVLDTLAFAFDAAGDSAKAIETETTAIDAAMKAGDNELVEQLRERLRRLQAPKAERKQ